MSIYACKPYCCYPYTPLIHFVRLWGLLMVLCGKRISLQAFFQHRVGFLFLGLLWFCGILCGVLVAFVAESSVSALMRTLLSSRVSIVCLMTVTFLPFLLAAFAAFISLPQLIYPLSFLEAFSVGYCNSCVAVAFGDAAWLVRWLYLFSSCCSTPVLYWFFSRCVQQENNQLRRDCAVGAVLLFAIGCIDYLFVSPFAASLFLF